MKDTIIYLISGTIIAILVLFDLISIAILYFPPRVYDEVHVATLRGGEWPAGTVFQVRDRWATPVVMFYDFDFDGTLDVIAICDYCNLEDMYYFVSHRSQKVSRPKDRYECKITYDTMNPPNCYPTMGWEKWQKRYAETKKRAIKEGSSDVFR